MQRRTKSLIFPSSSVSSPPVYKYSEDIQYAPISKKTAESASSTSLKRITLHLDHLTRLIMILKLPTMNRISTGKAIMVMISYQQPSQMTNRNPTKPKQLATSVRKMLSKRTQRLNIFHLFLQRRDVARIEMNTVEAAMTIDIEALLVPLVVKTRMMFWKEMQNVVQRTKKQMIICWSFLELLSSSSPLLLITSIDFEVYLFSSDLSSTRPQKCIMYGEDYSKMLEPSMGEGLSMLITLFPLIELYDYRINRNLNRFEKQRMHAFLTIYLGEGQQGYMGLRCWWIRVPPSRLWIE